jgi:hypothetical protein
LEQSGLDHGPISVHEKMRDLGMTPVPSTAALAPIFRDANVGRAEPRKKQRASYRRFVYPAPNACWQLDATDYVLTGGRTCVAVVRAGVTVARASAMLARMRRQLRPFHVRVGERVAVPRGGCSLRRSPQDGLAGNRVELQALAGGADQLRAVTVGQPPGHERLGPAAVGGMPADLERAAAVPAVPDCMDTHIEQIHKDHPLTLSGATVTTDHARAAGIRRGRGEGISRRAASRGTGCHLRERPYGLVGA